MGGFRSVCESAIKRLSTTLGISTGREACTSLLMLHAQQPLTEGRKTPEVRGGGRVVIQRLGVGASGREEDGIGMNRGQIRPREGLDQQRPLHSLDQLPRLGSFVSHISSI